MSVRQILVTGGAGFIGSHFVDRLVADGTRVRVLDDLSMGQRAHLASALATGLVELRVASVCDSAAVDEAMQGVDAVVHLAAAVGVSLVVQQPASVLETNVIGTRAVLAAAVERRVPVMLASTSEVYGRSERVPFREDDDVHLGPTSVARWAYACSKALDEWWALATAREHDLPATVLRFFNIVGPRQSGRYGMVVPSFVQQALAGGPITVYGDGSQTRSFLHVADAVEAMGGLLERLLAGPSSHDSGAEAVYNLGNPVEISIMDLAARVADAVGTSPAIVRVPYAQVHGAGFQDIARRVPDIGRLTAAIGFVPSRDLERVLADVIAEQRAQP